jgi:4-diphosphocytidyl-2-C-methyl-D-erythritol kinase
MSVRVFAPAKINLTLKVGRPRADGLHPLQSVVVFADVGDIVSAEPSDILSLTVEGEFASALGVDDNNLVLRAARALAEATGRPLGAALTLEKNLPIASGIGGGSSDAAAALRALNELWQASLSNAQLATIAQSLGADVPVCVGGVSAWMTGAGETFTPIEAPPFATVLVNPLAPLSTAEVYRSFDGMDLGSDLPNATPLSWRDRTEALAAIASLGNDLEAPARSLMPELANVAAELRADHRVSYAALSGSGATMFALVENMDAAAELADALQSAHPGWWVCDAELGGA